MFSALIFNEKLTNKQANFWQNLTTTVVASCYVFKLCMLRHNQGKVCHLLCILSIYTISCFVDAEKMTLFENKKPFFYKI